MFVLLCCTRLSLLISKSSIGVGLGNFVQLILQILFSCEWCCLYMFSLSSISHPVSVMHIFIICCCDHGLLSLILCHGSNNNLWNLYSLCQNIFLLVLVYSLVDVLHLSVSTASADFFVVVDLPTCHAPFSIVWTLSGQVAGTTVTVFIFRGHSNSCSQLYLNLSMYFSSGAYLVKVFFHTACLPWLIVLYVPPHFLFTCHIFIFLSFSEFFSYLYHHVIIIHHVYKIVLSISVRFFIIAFCSVYFEPMHPFF